MLLFRVLTMCMLALPLASCRIEIFAPKGGSIKSRTGQSDCAENANCYVETKPGEGYSETFTALPSPGYTFTSWKWELGTSYLCGGSSNPCALENIPREIAEKDVDLYLQPNFIQWPGFELSGSQLPTVKGAEWSAYFHVTNVFDIDLDGDQDLLFAGPQYTDTWTGEKVDIHVLLNGGNYDFTLHSISEFLIGSSAVEAVHPRWSAIADFNGDSILDIVIADHGYDIEPFPGHANILLLSEEPGKYRDSSKDAAFSDEMFTHWVVAGDVDNDGDEDIIFFELDADQFGCYSLRLLENDGNANFETRFDFIPEMYVNHCEKNWLAGYLADMDSDGFKDLILGGSSDLSLSLVLWNDGTGEFVQDHRSVLPQYVGWNIVRDVLAADIDSDGDNDLIFSSARYPSYQGRRLQIFSNDGAGKLSDVTEQLLRGEDRSENSGNLAFVDINGDSRNDIFIKHSGFEDDRYNITYQKAFLQATDGTFGPLRNRELHMEANFIPIDVDNDGDLDLLAWNNTGFGTTETELSWYLLINTQH